MYKTSALSVVIALGSAGTGDGRLEAYNDHVMAEVPVSGYSEPQYFPRNFSNSASTVDVSYLPHVDYMSEVTRVMSFLQDNSSDFDTETKSAISQNLWSLYD